MVNLPKCHVCGVELTNENWKPWSQRNHDYRCYECIKKYNREIGKRWRRTEKGREKVRRHTEWVRRNYIGVRLPNGKRKYIRVQGKRPYSEVCELCGVFGKRLVYHHWDDGDYSKGLWLCQHCHNIAEAADEGLPQKYLELKKQIEGVQTKWQG